MATKKRSIPLADTGIDWTKPAGEFTPSEKPEAAVADAPQDGAMRRYVGDTAASVARGAVQGVRMLSDVAGADNPVSGGLRSVEDYIGSLQSASAKADQQQIAAILKDAEGKGVLDQVMAGVKAFGVAPLQTMAQAAGTSIPTLATAMIPGAGPAAVAARMAGGLGMGAAQGVGGVKSSIYDEVKQAAINAGAQPDEANRRAAWAQSYSGPNAAQIALGAGLGAWAGRSGIEGALDRLVHGAAGKTAPGMVARVGLGAVAEGIPEAAQGGQEKFASNTALNNAGFPTDQWSGVAANATMEGLAGHAMGGAMAIPNPGVAAPVVDPAAAIRATKQPEGGPMTRAANAAIEAQAQAADAGMPSLPTLSVEQEQAALAAIEAQGGKDAKGLRQFAAAANSAAGARPTPTAQPGQGMPATVQSTGPSATVVDAPFSDRLLTLREQLGDEATRQALRAQFGDDALNQATYYANIANRPDVLKGVDRTRDNMLALAERMVSMALLKPINRPWVESDSTQAAQLEGPGAGPAQIGLDTTMTGRMRVDAAGNAAPETRADAINTQQAADGMGNDERQARKASAVNADPAPAAEPKPAGPPALGYDTTPTGRMRAGSEGVAPETAADAINTRQAQGERDAEAQRKADLGLTPDVQAVQDRNALGRSMPGDLLNPKGEPFKHERAAITAQKKAKGGAVLQVAGGWVVRPESATVEPANAQGQEAAAVPPAPVAPAQQEGTDRAGAAPAEASTSGAAGSAAAATVEAPGLNEVVRVRTSMGDHKYVRKADLAGDRKLLRMYRKDGTPVDGDRNGGGTHLHRGNIDPSGDISRELYQGVDLFIGDTGEIGGGFKSARAAKLALTRRGQPFAEFEIRSKDGRFFAVRAGTEAHRVVVSAGDSQLVSPASGATTAAVTAEIPQSAAPAPESAIDRRNRLKAERAAPAAASTPAAPAVVTGTGPADTQAGWVKPTEQNLQQRLDDARRIGREAAQRNEPRDPPQAFTAMEKQVWRAGWDQGRQIGSPIPQVPAPGAIDKPQRTLQEARTDAALDKQVRENGEVLTRRRWVESKVAEGMPTRITQEDRIKPMSRMQFFRANNEEQRAHERKIKEAGKKSVYWIGDYEVTKTEHDYASTLTATAATPAPTPVEAPSKSVAGAPGEGAPEAERYAAGRALTKEQRNQVLDSLVDVYKAKGADREQKGIGRDGNERYGYVHSPELFEKSDITGAMVRYYVTLPDGRRAHPTELFPDYTQADVDAALAKRESDEKADRENQAGAEARADKFAAPTVAAAEASWKERNKGMAGTDPLRDWRTGRQYTLVTFEKGGKFYSVRNDDNALMARMERGGWRRAEAPTLTPKAQAVKEALAGRKADAAALADAWTGMTPEARAGSLQAADVNMNTPTGRASVEAKRLAAMPWQSLPDALRAKLAPIVALRVPKDAQPAATHKDPGEPAEPVTPAVVREAIKTGVQATDRKPSVMKAELLAKIDEAVKDAPDYMDFQAVVKTMGLKDATAVFTDAKGTLGDKAAPQGYSRPTLRFKIEGDGVFTVNNTVRQLLTFRAKVEASPGFRDRQAPAGLNERATDTLDRRSADAAIGNMIEEGDFQAALDYAQAKGVDMANVKLTKVLRDRLDKWEQDQASAKRMAEYEAANPPAPKPEPAPAPAAEPEPDDIPEAGIASQTFEQWAKAQYAGNEYKAKYLEKFGGDEKRAILASVVGTIDTDRTTAELLKAAKQEYRRELFNLPRESVIALEVWDELDNMLKVEAQRHFYDLDARITRRDQDTYSAKAKAEAAKKAPYEAAFAEVDAEIRRLDKIPGPETQKQKDLSARLDRLREAIYQIGQGKEPDGRLLRKVDEPEPLDLKGFTRTPRGNGAFDLSDGNMRVSVEPTERGFYRASFGSSAKSGPRLNEQQAIEWAANIREESKALQAPVSSREGQMRLANRGSRIASLKAMNDQLRKIAPAEAWADKNIEDAADLDALQGQISSALVAAQRGPAAVNPLRAELEEMSGAELRAIMDRMGLAGTRMVMGERVDALLAEDEAEVRAAIAAAAPESEPAKPTPDLQTPPAEQAAAILNAAAEPPNGRERLDVLKDVKAGAITPEEVAAAFPPAPITDVGEKIGGARKDMAESGGTRAKKGATDDRPAWARRFEISQIVTPGGMVGEVKDAGRWIIRDSRSLDWMKQPKQVGRSTYATKEEAEASVPLAAVSLKHRTIAARDGKYEIWRDINDRKRVKVVDQQFDSREEAMAYMMANAVQIVETNTTFGEADMPLPPDRARAGPQRRTGNVNGQDFKDTFGLRGVEFGNWNNQDERQSLMNDAWDGLMDLAEVLNVPARALGMNGDLALAFGARGHGLNSARAHYEPARAVINLTKESGAGSLAHEWFHALDHYFGRQDGKASAEWKMGEDGTRTLAVQGDGAEMVSTGFRGERSGVRPKLREAYEAMLRTMTKKAETYVEDTAKADKFTGVAREELAEALASLRRGLAEQLDVRYWKRNNKPATAEQLAEFDAIAKQMLDGEVTALATDWKTFLKGGDKPANARGASIATRWTNDSLERLSAIHKEVRGRNGFDGTNKQGVMDRLRGNMERYSQRLKMLADAQGEVGKVRAVPTDFAMNARELDQGRGTDYWTTPHEMAARAFQGYVEDKIAERGGMSRFLNYAPENAAILTPWGFKRPYPAGEERKAINDALDKFISALETRADDAGNVAMFSRAEAQQQPASDRRQAVEALVQQIAGRWANAPEVVVVNSMDDPRVPEAVRRDEQTQQSKASAGAPEGFFHGGKVYLVAGQLGGDADVVRVLFHEAMGHYGLRGTFGADLATILDRLAVLNAAKVRAKAKQYGLDYDKPSDRRAAAEEVLADMAQRTPDIGWGKKSIAAVRTWLRTHVPGFRKMALTDAEIVRSYILPARAFVQRGGPAGNPGGGVAFSRASMADAVRNFSQAGARNAFLDAVTTHGGTNLWGRTVGTQYHKAQANPTTFGRVFDAVQDYIKDTSVFANRAADLAPSLLPKLDSWVDLKKGGLLHHGAKPADTAKAGEAIFRGTLDKVLYDEATLRSQFGLTDLQVGLYKEFRRAVDESLDGMTKTEILRLAGKDGRAVRAAVLAAPDAESAAEVLTAHLTELAELTANDDLLGTVGRIGLKVKRLAQLQDEGYAPLMRFGKHTLHVTRPDGGTEFFGMYESVREANNVARLMRADPAMAGMTFTQGVMSQEDHKLFNGLTLDSLELFADSIGQQDNPVYQEYLKRAMSNRSAMKRMIERKAIKGYSDDVTRVLASFVTSNARMSAGNLHLTDAKKMAEAMPKEQGDLRDDAIKLVEYVTNPTEEAAAVRGLLFTSFIGGSVASALVNLTQPITMTLPYLTQWGGAKAGKRMLAAAGMVASGKGMDADLRAALARAEQDGIVSPQEIHHLQAEAMATVSNKFPVLKKVAFVWGSMFSLAEQFNRRVSFVAAYQTAQQEGIADPFAFAEKAVVETQGLYNKGNKANLARGAAGATVMTFKQFSTHYLEFLTRMAKSGPEGRKAVAVALALLLLTAGAGGLPFADDLDDLIDTLGQFMGHDTNSKRWKRQFIAQTLGLGDDAAEVATRGITALPGMPVDLSLRMGLGNLLPATGLFLRSNTDTGRQLLEVAGAAGGMAANVMDGVKKAAGGDVVGGVMNAMPIAVQNMAKAAQMWDTGEYRNKKGQKVMNVDAVDGAMKFIGFQPAAVARESSRIGETMRTVQLAKNVEGEIAGRWAQGMADGDREAVASARQELADWNKANPQAPIRITMPQVLARLKALKTSRAERTVKQTPKELRPLVAETLK